MMAEDKSELREESVPGISHSVGDLVLVKWNDGMVYFAKIKRIDNRSRKCVVVFDDKSTDEADFSQIHSVDETTTDIICIKCKHDDSDAPNEIVLCDTCGIGYHQLCHIPTIPASAIQLDQPWHCIYCQKKLKNPYLTESIDVIQTLFDGDDAVTSDHDTNDDIDHDHDTAQEYMDTEEVTLPHSKADGEVVRRSYSVDHGRHIRMDSQISTGPGRKRKGRRASEMSVSRTVSPRLETREEFNRHPIRVGRGGKRRRMGDGIRLMKKRRTSTVQTHTLSVKQVPLSMPTRKMPQVVHECLSSDDDSEEEHPQGSPEIEPISSDRRPRSLRVSLTIPPSLESSPAPPSNSSHPVSPILPSPACAALSPQPSSEHSFVTSSSQPHSPIADKPNMSTKPTSAHDRSDSHISDDVFSDFCSSSQDKNASAPPQLSHVTTTQPTSKADSEKSLYTNPPLTHSGITTVQTDKAISQNVVIATTKISSDLAEAHGSQSDNTQCTSPLASDQVAAKVIVSPGVTQLMPVKHRKTSVIQQSFSPPANSSSVASTTAFRYPSPPLHATAASTAKTSANANPDEPVQIVESRSSLPPARTFQASTASSLNQVAPSQPNRPSGIPAPVSHTSVVQLSQQHKVQHQPQSVFRQPSSLPPPPLQAQANSGSIHAVQPQRRMQDIPGQVIATREVHHPETICAPQRTVITSGSQANPMVSVMVTPTTISATGEVAAVYTFVPASHVKGSPNPVVTYTSSPSPSTKEVIYNSSLTPVEPQRAHQQQVCVNRVPAGEPTAVVYTSNPSNHQRGGAVLARAQSEFKHANEMMLDQQPLNSNGNATKSYAIVTAPANVAVHAPPRYLTSSPPPLAPKQLPVHAIEHHRVVHDSIPSQQRIPVQQPRRQFVEPAHPANNSVNRRPSQISIVREIPPLRSHIESGIDLLHDETSTELADHLRKLSHRYGKEFDSLGKDKLMEIFHDAWKKFQGNGRKYEAFVKHRKIARTANIEAVTPTPAVPAASPPVASPVQKGRILVQRPQPPQYIAVNGPSPVAMAAATPVSTPPHPLPPLAPVNNNVNFVYAAAYPNPSMQQQPVIVGATPNVINVVETPSPPPLSSAQLSRSHQVQTSGVFVPPPSTNPHTVTVLQSPTIIPRPPPHPPHQRILKPKPQMQHVQQSIPQNPQIIQSRGSSLSSPSSSSSAVLIQRPIVAPSEHDIALAAAAQPRRHARVSGGPTVARTPVGNGSIQRRTSSSLAGQPHACARCERSATYLCSGCHNEWYCSRDCQLKAWDSHAEHCKA